MSPTAALCTPPALPGAVGWAEPGESWGSVPFCGEFSHLGKEKEGRGGGSCPPPSTALGPAPGAREGGQVSAGEGCPPPPPLPWGWRPAPKLRRGGRTHVLSFHRSRPPPPRASIPAAPPHRRLLPAVPPGQPLRSRSRGGWRWLLGPGGHRDTCCHRAPPRAHPLRSLLPPLPSLPPAAAAEEPPPPPRTSQDRQRPLDPSASRGGGGRSCPPRGLPRRTRSGLGRAEPPVGRAAPPGM